MGWLDKRRKARKLAKWLDAQGKEFDKREETIKTIRKECFDNARSFQRALELKGYEQLGSGYYASVLGKPGSDRVIKICRSPHRDGWLDYVKWAHKKGYAGSIAPKVYSYKWIKCRKGNGSWQEVMEAMGGGKSENGFGIAIMERLPKTVSEAGSKEASALVPGLFEYAVNHKNLKAASLLDDLAPGLARLGDELKDNFKEAHIDIHGGNFMTREDGTIVLTDPLSGFKTENYKERFRAEVRQ